MKKKFKKFVEQTIKETKLADLNWLKHEVDYLFKVDLKKRNEERVHRFKVGEQVKFKTPNNNMFVGVVQKIGRSKIRVGTEHGSITVPATKVGFE